MKKQLSTAHLWKSLPLFSMIFLCAVFLFISCKSTKKINKAISKKSDSSLVVVQAHDSLSDPKADSIRFIKTVLDHITAHNIDFRTFSAKVKVHYEGSDGKDYEFNAFIRMEKNKTIWVSVNALLGIEAFRALITPDSVIVLNKLDKIVQRRSVSALQDISHLPFDFQTLQALLIGNAIYLDSNIAFYRKNENGISLLSLGNLFRNYLTLNANDFTLKHSKLDDVDQLRARTCDITYGDYEKKDTVFFSTYRKISVAEKSKLDIELAFKQYSFNENLNFPFSIPKNYKRK